MAGMVLFPPLMLAAARLELEVEDYRTDRIRALISEAEREGGSATEGGGSDGG